MVAGYTLTNVPEVLVIFAQFSTLRRMNMAILASVAGATLHTPVSALKAPTL